VPPRPQARSIIRARTVNVTVTGSVTVETCPGPGTYDGTGDGYGYVHGKFARLLSGPERSVALSLRPRGAINEFRSRLRPQRSLRRGAVPALPPEPRRRRRGLAPL